MARESETHAPYAILGDLVILYGKTTKTACGKRRPTKTLVPRGEATCTGCREQIAADRAEVAELEEVAKQLGLTGSKEGGQ